MSKIKLSKYFIFISIITFLAIFFLVVSQSYNNLMQATKENENNPLTQSISPLLDVDVIEEIEKRQEVEALPSSVFPLPSDIEIDDVDEIENNFELTP